MAVSHYGAPTSLGMVTPEWAGSFSMVLTNLGSENMGISCTWKSMKKYFRCRSCTLNTKFFQDLREDLPNIANETMCANSSA